MVRPLRPTQRRRSDDDVLAALRVATAQYHQAKDDCADARESLREAIDNVRASYQDWRYLTQEAMARGIPRADIAAAADVTPARLYQP